MSPAAACRPWCATTPAATGTTASSGKRWRRLPSGAPSPALLKAIDAKFGSLDAFKTAFKQAGVGRFGSGWVWLIVDTSGRLAITSTPNQDNPLMDVAEVKGAPILGNDVWEHAYYLKYQNRRADYLDGWWSVVNWPAVSERHAAATR